MIKEILTMLSGNDNPVNSQTKEKIEQQEKETELIGNCFVFTSPAGGTGVSTVVSEIANILSTKYHKRTCIVEASQTGSSQFSKYLIKAKNQLEYDEDTIKVKKEKSIADFLLAFNPVDENEDMKLSEVILELDKNLYLTTFASSDIKSTFNVDYVKYIKYLEVLKNYFDIVLIDMHWNPAFEGCVGSVESATIVYTLLDDSTDLTPYYRMKNFFALTGSSYKFKNIILTKVSDEQFVKQFINHTKDINLITTIPYLFIIEENKNKKSIDLNMNTREKKLFNNSLEEIIQSLFKGVINKENKKEGEI